MKLSQLLQQYQQLGCPFIFRDVNKRLIIAVLRFRGREEKVVGIGNAMFDVPIIIIATEEIAEIGRGYTPSRTEEHGREFITQRDQRREWKAKLFLIKSCS